MFASRKLAGLAPASRRQMSGFLQLTQARLLSSSRASEDLGSQPSVMFVCRRNSCRSQMAEGWAKKIAEDRLRVYSSGLVGSTVHPTAQQVMKEAGVDITFHTSDNLDDFNAEDFDAVISMCGCGNKLPQAWQDRPYFRDWELEDPDGKSLETFYDVRGQIKQKIESLVDTLVDGETAWRSKD